MAYPPAPMIISKNLLPNYLTAYPWFGIIYTYVAMHYRSSVMIIRS